MNEYLANFINEMCIDVELELLYECKEMVTNSSDVITWIHGKAWQSLDISAIIRRIIATTSPYRPFIEAVQRFANHIEHGVERE